MNKIIHSISETIKDDIIASILFVLLVLTVFLDIIVGLITKDSTIILAITTFALVIVTGIYGWHTRQLAKSTSTQATESERSRQISYNSMLNTYAPIIKIIAKELWGGGIEVNYKNVGPGPALNMICWINHEKFPHLSSDTNKKIETVVGTKEEGTYFGDVNLKLSNFSSGFDVIAEYKDIYGRDFISRLEIINKQDRSLQYGLKEKIKGC